MTDPIHTCELAAAFLKAWEVVVTDIRVHSCELLMRVGEGGSCRSSTTQALKFTAVNSPLNVLELARINDSLNQSLRILAA